MAADSRTPRDLLAFALDLPSVEQALTYVNQLAGRVGVFKIGLELFVQAGPAIIQSIRKQTDAAVFLDLKLHDIPTTVGRATKRAADLGVNYLTVHCGENRAMLESAVENAGDRLGILAVTLLTSVGGEDLRQAGFKNRFADQPKDLVDLRAQAAHSAGCAGLVCSAMEANRVKQQFPHRFMTVTPGIRLIESHDDQKRVMTPSQAIRNGSDLLVVGRPIRDANDPAAAADAITADISQALKSEAI
jgi:orotidine-5'-phosphate decarboxylase